MKKTLIATAVASACLLFAAQVLADDAPVAAAVPAAPPASSPIYSIGGFDLTGQVDVGYTHLSGSGKFVSGVNDRVFDFLHKQVFFHSLDLQFAKLPDNGFGGLLDLTLGRDADTIAAYGTINKSKGPDNGAHHYSDVTQAYVYYGAAPFSIIAGKYVTNAGAEVIKSSGDVNYSKSILFGYAIPFTHTGVRATYKVSDTLTLLGGVNNGWDDFQDTNSDKTIEFGATFTPSKAFTLIGSYYGGKEQVANYPKSTVSGQRDLIDLVGTYVATDQLSFVLNYDYATQENVTSLVSGSTIKAKWDGVAGYANYQINDQWRLVLRGEYFDDKDGYRTGVIQKWKEGTLTLAYLPTKSVEIRAEVRSDHSDKSAFLKSDGITPTSTQNSFGLEGLYKF